jgi:hypothetical protein
MVGFVKTSDNGFALFGQSHQMKQKELQTDLFLIKTDKHGNQKQEKIIHFDNYICFNHFVQTHDRGYVIVGWIKDDSNEKNKEREDDTHRCVVADALLVRLNSEGDVLWRKRVCEHFYNGFNPHALSVQETKDHGYIIVGSIYTGSTLRYFSLCNIHLVKIERSGNIGWSKTFYSRSSDYFLSIQQTHDGGYVLGSYIFKPKEKKQRENYINIRKVDPEGNMLFSHNFPCSDGFVIPQYDHKVVMFRALKIMLTKDGGYIITCPICEFQRTPLLDKKLLKIIKVSPEGSEQWTVELMGADLEESSSVSLLRNRRLP